MKLFSDRLGGPVPDSLVRRYLQPSQIEDGDSIYRVACVEISLVERGRGSDLGSLLDRPRGGGQFGRFRPGGTSDEFVEGLLGLKGWQSKASGALGKEKTAE